MELPQSPQAVFSGPQLRARNAAMLMAAVFLGILVVAGGYFFFGRSGTPKPGSCLVLEERYCKLAERVVWAAPDGTKMDLLGFRLPAGAVIFSPRDGSVSGDTGGSSALHPNASVVGVYQPDSYDAFQATGDLALNIRGLSTVTAGVPLAQLQDTGIRLVGDYNLIVEFLAADDQQRIVTDEGTIAQLFP